VKCVVDTTNTTCCDVVASDAESVAEAGAPGNTNAAVARIARHIYESMEGLDQAYEDHVSWDDLPDHNKVFYVTVVRALLERRSDIVAALSNSNHIEGGAVITE
jgi:adenylosuccinate synthase